MTTASYKNEERECENELTELFNGKCMLKFHKGGQGKWQR